MQDCAWKYQSKRTIFPPLGLASTVFAACQHRVSCSTCGHPYLCAAQPYSLLSVTEPGHAPPLQHILPGVQKGLKWCPSLNRGHICVSTDVHVYKWIHAPHRHQCNALYLPSSSAACLGKAGLSSGETDSKGKGIKRDHWTGQTVWVSSVFLEMKDFWGQKTLLL